MGADQLSAKVSSGAVWRVEVVERADPSLSPHSSRARVSYLQDAVWVEEVANVFSCRRQGLPRAVESRFARHPSRPRR